MKFILFVLAIICNCCNIFCQSKLSYVTISIPNFNLYGPVYSSSKIDLKAKKCYVYKVTRSKINFDNLTHSDDSIIDTFMLFNKRRLIKHLNRVFTPKKINEICCKNQYTMVFEFMNSDMSKKVFSYSFISYSEIKPDPKMKRKMNSLIYIIDYLSMINLNKEERKKMIKFRNLFR